MNYVFDLKQIPADKEALIGGKAASLSLMLRHLRVRIPGGAVITSDAFEGGTIRKEAAAELDTYLQSLRKDVTYAVRSSAIGEDGQSRSYAGQYETITDVPKDGIREAVAAVISSSDSARVEGYQASFSEKKSGIGVVIQEFVKPQYAGVVFTSDVITGRDDQLVGNYVCGEGEALVSGTSNAEPFRIGVLKYSYEGNSAFQKYAKKLRSYCLLIRRFYGVPMDIEWAVSGDTVYILQARPITTLQRHILPSYDINGTRSGYKLLTRTNVGEIFMEAVSPMTMSVLDKINDLLGLPEWLDNVCGQPYMNISVMCSLLVSFGRTRQQALDAIRDLAGEIPENAEIPLTYFDKKTFLRKVFRLLFPKEKTKLSRQEKRRMVENLVPIARATAQEISTIESSEELLRYWNEVIIKRLNDGLSSILGECGTAMIPLFNTRKKIAKIAG